MSDDVKRLAEAKKHLDKASDLQVEIVAIEERIEALQLRKNQLEGSVKEECLTAWNIVYRGTP